VNIQLLAEDTDEEGVNEMVVIQLWAMGIAVNVADLSYALDYWANRVVAA
jgi:hypothetical protein